MVAPSKLFGYPMSHVHCGNIIHSLPNQSCTQALLWNIYRNHVSSAKYYLPTLVLMPLLLNCRRLTKRRLWSTARNYLETTFFASIMNALSFYLICVFRRLNGRFVYLCTPGLSNYLAALINWWAPPKVLQFFSTGITHAAMEAVLREMNAGLVRSRPAQTVLFMLSSLVVLRQQQKHLYSGFWFIKPSSMTLDYSKWPLLRRLKQASLELATYFGMGFTIDLFSVLMSLKLKKLRLKSTSFIVTYIGLYKIVQVLFAGVLEMKHLNLLAAFVSGASYGLFSHVPFSYMCFAVVIAIQALYKELCKVDVSHNKRLAALLSMPWAKLLIPPTSAYLANCMFYKQHLLSGLAKSFMDDTCDKNVNRIYTLIQLPLETIFNKTKGGPQPKFFF
ncbi:hypothetical protein AWZ03_005124 [Drosophila navojoa]|uniref:Transmembrane protein 135 N-terminal domain-containing protein n=1 Tax=Drosophila navojoa TaxID=7232 RepID=A0A484BHW5_DRONA|nr:uncharacterized protein LOC115562277 [Drosophila navojoa]TDG48379.1 hypothetical protein AWZ03_005124 [Drosophila navojoa]